MLASLEKSFTRLGLLVAGLSALGGTLGLFVALALLMRGKRRLRLDTQTVIPIGPFTFFGYGAALGTVTAVVWWALTW